MENIKGRILENVSRVHPVNTLVALSGTPFEEGSKHLEQLVREGVVETVYITAPDNVRLALYRRAPRFGFVREVK